MSEGFGRDVRNRSVVGYITCHRNERRTGLGSAGMHFIKNKKHKGVTSRELALLQSLLERTSQISVSANRANIYVVHLRYSCLAVTDTS